MCDVSAVVGVAVEVCDCVSSVEETIVSRSRVLRSADAKEEDLDINVRQFAGRFGKETRFVLLEHVTNSIAAFFTCMTLLAVISLRDLWHKRHLRRKIEMLFEYAFLPDRGFPRPLSGRVHVKRVIWPLADYERCLKLFNSGKRTIK